MSGRWDDATGVVTPEAVELRFQDATVGSRGVAVLFDFAILVAVLTGLNLTIGWLAERADIATSWIATTALIVVNFVLLLGYPIAFETLTGGKTPGKAAMGLRAVTVEGGRIRFRHAAIRGAFWLVDFFGTFGVAAVLASLLSRRRQRLGDMVAGTVVLRERSAAPAPQVASFEIPPGALEYAATIDVSGLSVRDYEAVREFLLREPTLAGLRRQEIAERLARPIADRLRHQRHPGVNATLFLTCVVSRYAEQQRGSVIPPVAAMPAPAPASVPAPPQPPTDGAPGGFAPPG